MNRFSTSRAPVDISGRFFFSLLFTDELLDEIVDQTERYAVQNVKVLNVCNLMCIDSPVDCFCQLAGISIKRKILVI